MSWCYNFPQLPPGKFTWHFKSSFYGDHSFHIQMDELPDPHLFGHRSFHFASRSGRLSPSWVQHWNTHWVQVPKPLQGGRNKPQTWQRHCQSMWKMISKVDEFSPFFYRTERSSPVLAVHQTELTASHPIDSDSTEPSDSLCPDAMIAPGAHRKNIRGTSNGLITTWCFRTPKGYFIVFHHISSTSWFGGWRFDHFCW